MGNPYEVGLGWQVNLGKEDFVSKAALARIKQQGVAHKLAGLKVGGKRHNWYPADFYHVKDALTGKIVGYITSIWWSPSNESNIAFAFLPVALTELGTQLAVALPDEYADRPG